MDKNIILEFVDFINKHNLEGMYELMSDDHTFIDAHNNSITGKDKMKTSWQFYFEWFPDYTIEVSDIIQGGSCSAVFGFANGTYRNLHNPEKSNHFHLPAAWRVIIENDKIKQWQVYADTKIPFEIIERNKNI
jgi:ketosteroid isomerase-like protein